MKPTAYVLVGSWAAGLGVWAAAVSAAPQDYPSGSAAEASAASQAATQDPAGPRNQANRLLRQAREAITRGDWSQAERHLVQAEGLNIRYDQLYERFEDTPAKVRKVLDDARATKSGAGPRPSDRFSPSAVDATVRQPGTATAAPQLPRDPQTQLELLTNDGAGKARAYLNKGRLALQAGDLAGAIAWRQKALAMGAALGPGEYSPDTLAQELRRAGVKQEQLVYRGPAAAQTSPLRPEDFTADPRAALLTAPPLRNNQRGVAPGMPGPTEPRRLPQSMAADPARKPEVLRLMAQARLALDRGDATTAQRLAAQAQASGLPDEAFGPNEQRPEHLLLEVSSALNRQQGRANQAYPVTSAYDPGLPTGDRFPVRQGVYNPQRDGSRNMPAQATETTPLGPAPDRLRLTPAEAAALTPPPGQTGQAASAYDLFRNGVQALEQQDRKAALDLFNKAWKREAELDPQTRQALRDKLTLLQYAAQNASSPPGNDLEEVSSQQQLVTQQLFREISREQTAAERLRESDPRGSLERLQKLRERVEQETLEPPARKQYLALIDRSLKETESYLAQHRADIELKERNQAVAEDVNNHRQEKLDNQTKVAQLNEKFNDLMEQKRYPEAEVLAKQASELDARSEVVRSMLQMSKMAWRVQEQDSIKDDKERGFYGAMTSVERSSTPMDDTQPITFDVKKWDKLSSTRRDWLKREHSRLTPTELEIQKSLKVQVEVRFDNRPLSQVLDALGRMAGVNVYLDPEGLRAEGVSTDDPVTINLAQSISLRSALNLILEPLRLSYVIQNEVLRITSEQTRNSDVYPAVYNVADLVIPIPNFIPSYNIGLPGAIREAYNGATHGQMMNQLLTHNSKTTGAALAAGEADSSAATSASVLAQMNSTGMLPGVAPRSTPSPGSGYIPGNMGGATQADFDTLIDLITQTIAPQTWSAVGGPGSIERFPTNLSLVISQTQEIHEQIADLLEQLRRLQDLQVTIEVRFITLNDKFYEKIGVSMNFNVEDNTFQVDGQNAITSDKGPSQAFGLDPTGQPTTDFDYQFRQGAAGTIGMNPKFGGFDAATAANVGFAILSDIEVYFLLQAAEGDERTNVLQAPKVTLFNGQTGFVSDTSQRPFVTSVIPVVGDFAAAHQPVVVVLNEGTSLSVQAVVSPDRRFVRLTLIPFFSSIGDVSTFTFSGRTTSDTGTTAVDPSDPTKKVQNGAQRVIEGTTVQLPTFNFTTVSTTVSVPDGGTVLLGGIKRLSEGRSERGVPLLSKIPYLSRLFKNVGIGRETQSLMMMVTPRIIIQEEEEFQQTGYDSAAP
ncbi:MAG: general secretion pathway protein GspD [Planctomycetota bacterium]|nr:general secretion pathway protein GspD [Planctomycetota bacterium]